MYILICEVYYINVLWPELIQPFAFRWNSRHREKLGGYTPFEIVMYENPKLSIECMLSPYDGNYRKQNKLSYHSEQVQEMFERRVAVASTTPDLSISPDLAMPVGALPDISLGVGAGTIDSDTIKINVSSFVEHSLAFTNYIFISFFCCFFVT